ncbi:MAG: hypothetical protein ICV83_09280 [Cytophagales bacterium]|nr:hypothetical protein [Cytophagales bacterium]
MKKLILFTGLLMLPSFSFGAGIPITDIPRLILEFITNKILMEKDAKVQGDKLQKLLEVLKEAKGIRARHTELQGLEDDLEKELRLVRQVEHLKLHDVLRIVDKVVSVTNALYAEDMPYLEEYALLQEAIPGIESADRMYDFVLGSASLYGEMTRRAPATYKENADLLRQQSLKQYGLEVDATKRSLHLALSYGQLAGDLREQAEDLQQQVNREGRWSMSGVGELFSDLLDLGGETPGLDDLFGLPDQVQQWSQDIRKKLGIQALDNLFGDGEDKSGQIGQEVENAVGGFDFLGLFESVLGLAGGGADLSVPEYQVNFEKEGLRLSTGERIEAQDIALDNLEQSIELQLESDRLVTEALRKSEHQQKVDQTYQNALLRKSLLAIPFNP